MIREFTAMIICSSMQTAFISGLNWIHIPRLNILCLLLLILRMSFPGGIFEFGFVPHATIEFSLFSLYRAEWVEGILIIFEHSFSCLRKAFSQFHSSTRRTF